MKKIAVDVMGSDHGPKELIKGVIKFLKSHHDVECILFGDKQIIESALNGHKERVSIVHTSQVIGMDEGALSIRRKKDSSLVKAMEHAKDGASDAVISCGNSAAVVAASYFVLKTLPTIDRPGFMPILPTTKGSKWVMCDVGANLQNDAKDLSNFAVMGTVYAEKVLGIKNARTAILNVGAEKGKGPEHLNEAYELLENNKSVKFKGFIEPRYLFANQADVVVCDGYAGNIALKTLEGTASTLGKELKKTLTSNIFKKLYIAINVPILKMLKTFRNKFDYKNSAGAIVLGVNKIVVKSHGSSDSKELFVALKETKRSLDNKVIEIMKKELKND